MQATDDGLDEVEEMFVSKPVAKPRAAPVASAKPERKEDPFKPETIESIPSIRSPEKQEAPGKQTEEDIEDSDEAPPASFSPFEPKNRISISEKPVEAPNRYKVPAEEDEEVGDLMDDYDAVLDLEPQPKQSQSKPSELKHQSQPESPGKPEVVASPEKKKSEASIQQLSSEPQMPRRGIPDASNPGDVVTPAALKQSEKEDSIKEIPDLADLDAIKPVAVKEEPKPKASALEAFDDDDDDWGNSDVQKSSVKQSNR